MEADFSQQNGLLNQLAKTEEAAKEKVKCFHLPSLDSLLDCKLHEGRVISLSLTSGLEYSKNT